MDQHNWPARSRSLIWEGEIARLEQDAVTSLQRRLKAARQNLTDAHNKRPDLWQSPGLRNAIDDALRVVSGDVPTLRDAAKLGTLAGLDIVTGEANLHGWGSLAGQFSATPNLSAAALVSAKSIDSIRKMRADLKRRILDTVSVGVLEGEGAYEIAKRVLGTGLKGLAGRDGVFRPAAHRAEAIARTTVNEAFNRAAVDQYDRLNSEYPELGLEYEWVSQIDRRTSLVCRALNGKRRKQTEEFSAEGWTGKQGPAHPFCRSRVVAVVTKDAPKQAKPAPPARTSKPAPKPVQVKPEPVKLPNLPQLGYRNPALNKWRNVWDRAPQDLQQVMGTLGEPKLLPVNPQESAYYHPGAGKGVHMSRYSPEDSRGRAVFAHEMGHYLDDALVKAPVSKAIGVRGLRVDDYQGLTESQKGYLKITAWDKLTPEWQEYVIRQEAVLENTFADKGSKFFSNTLAFNSAREADVKRLLDRDHSKTTESARKLVNEIETDALKASPRGDDPLESWFKRVDDLTLNRLAGMLEEKHPDSLASRLVKKSGTQGLTFDRVAALVIDPMHPDSLAILADRVAFGDNHGIAQDMIGAATLNQVGNGHTLEYYKERGLGGQNTEMFANITALYASGDPLVREYLQTTVPQTTTIYAKALEDFNNGQKPSE